MLGCWGCPLYERSLAYFICVYELFSFSTIFSSELTILHCKTTEPSSKGALFERDQEKITI